MGCCGHCRGIELEFNEKTAAREMKRYRRRGPRRSTRILLEALRREANGGESLLDVGGGIGTIHHELVADGVASATHVDASNAYLVEAREEARRRGHEDRVRFVHGDFVELAPSVAEADVVTLDRVICCYPDLKGLVGLSAARARTHYGVVYPRNVWWMKLALPLPNLYFRLRGSPFRVFLHASEDVAGVVRRQGLERVFLGETLLWRIEVYRRGGQR